MVRIKFTEEFTDQPAIIRIVGVGGAGGNAVNRMIEAGLSHVEFIAANTDAQDLRRNLAPEKVHIGESLTKGLGVGGNPVLGRQAAEETRERLSEVLNGADMIFITAGMGGGTGTGGAPVVAEIARSLESPPLVVGVVTRPFEFEGHVRSVQAESGIRELKSRVDTLVTISNDRLFDIIDSTTTSLEAYRVADDVLRQAVQAITDVITSGLAAERMKSMASLTSYIVTPLLPVMLIRTPFAPSMVKFSRRGDPTARRAASNARFEPSPSPIPINASPAPAIIFRTSAKSTLTIPPEVMTSVMA